MTQAQAWMGWEMAVGFRRLNQLQVWDGRRWSQEEMPGSRRALPPRGRPRGAAAAPPAHANDAAFPAAQSNSAAAGASSNGSAAGAMAAAASTADEVSADGARPSDAASHGAAVQKPCEAAAQSAPRPVADGVSRGAQQPRTATGHSATAGATAGAAASTADSGSNSSSAAKGSGKTQSGASGAADAKAAEVPAMVAQPLLECHYSLHGAFLTEPLLEVRSTAWQILACSHSQVVQPLGCLPVYHSCLEPSAHSVMRAWGIALWIGLYEPS